MNNAPENPQDFDFSQLKGLITFFYEIGNVAAKSAIVFQEIIISVLSKIKELKQRINEIGQGLGKLFEQTSAIKKLGDAQFVYWEYMTPDFVIDIVETKNINKTLREYFIKKHFKKVTDTINKTLDCERMCKRKHLYMQAVNAFRNSDCDLAVIGFVAVFDGLLSDISDNSMTSIIERLKIIEKKFENKEPIYDDECAIFILASTFYSTVESFAEFSDFNKPEPKMLNRHWIAHGRSTRKKTKLDCVKMINLIYGLLIVSDLKTTDILSIENDHGE